MTTESEMGFLRHSWGAQGNDHGEPNVTASSYNSQVKFCKVSQRTHHSGLFFRITMPCTINSSNDARNKRPACWILCWKIFLIRCCSWAKTQELELISICIDWTCLFNGLYLRICATCSGPAACWSSHSPIETLTVNVCYKLLVRRDGVK